MMYVEFDDGDSGYMRLEGIRMLPKDYPPVEHDQDPLDTLSRRRRRASSGTSATSSQRAASRLSVSDERWEPPPPLAGAELARPRHMDSSKPPRTDESTPARGEDADAVWRDESKKRAKAECEVEKKDEPLHRRREESEQKGGTKQKRADSSKKRRLEEHGQKRKEAPKQKKTAQAKQARTEPTKSQKKEQSKQTARSKTSQHPAENGKSEGLNTSATKPAKQRKQKRSKEPPEPASNGVGHEREVGSDARGERRAEKKKSAKRRLSAGESYVVEQESELKIRIKSPSPGRRQSEDAQLKRQPAADAKKRKKSEGRQRHPSGMAAFLPERQLWHWSGKGVKRPASKGKAKREVYKGIARGPEEISVGDCAVFLSAGLPDRPYVGRIHALWEATSGQMLVQVAWFYHPEETCGLDRPLNEPKGGLFESPHMDENDVQTISHRCRVVSLADYRRLAHAAADNETFYQAGFYEPRSQKLTFEPQVVD
ncbi:protein winged eye-like [Pollicipes pollicipes]|nr:protein winged eye-like [Pollicipes pollicipes]